MPDFATLVLRIDKSSSDAATVSLDRLTVSASKTEAATKKLGTESERSAVAAKNAHVSFGRFQNAINNLGLSAVGVNGPMQKVVETIAILGVGSAVVTGVLAGIAAITLGLSKLTEQTRKAQKAYDDYLNSLRKTGPLDAIGGQLDEVQHKLDNMGSGFLGAATRFTRSVLSRSLLGQLFGVQSEQELRQQAADLGKQYGDAFRFGQNDAYVKGRAAAEERQKKALAEIEARKKAEIEYWNIRNNGLTSFRGNLPLEFGGRGGSYGSAGGDVPAFLQGQRPDGLPAFQAGAEDSSKIAESWQSTAASVANVVTLLANADDLTTQMLGTVLDITSQIADAVKAGNLSTGGALSLVAGGLSLFARLGAEDAESRRSREIFQQNTEAVERNSRALDNVTAGITGNAFSTARGGVGALLGAGASGLGTGPRGSTGILNTAAVSAILAAQGTSLSELRDFAKSLDITLDTTSTRTFLDSLEKLNERMQQMALVTLKSFGSQLDLINRQWAIAGTTDPFAKLADLVKLIQGEQGSPRLGKYLGSLDLSQAADRNAGRDYLLREIERARNNQLKTEDLGGLTVQQYLDFLSQFGSLLNEANQAIQSTIDNLSAFADSLKLDQSLTTLSPAQQLAEARRQYEDVLKAAQAGDLSAANRLPDVARQFLSASRSFNASSPAYAADFARVLADTQAVQKLIGSTEDGWKAVEKPLVNVVDNTQTTVERLETLIEVQRVGLQETVDKLDAIRSEMAASVLAQKVGFEGKA